MGGTMFENLGKMAGKLGGVEAMKSHLSGLSFPIEKAQIISMAQSKGFPEPLVSLLNKLPENRKFENADDIVNEAKTLQ
jgi:hypothetical protein